MRVTFLFPSHHPITVKLPSPAHAAICECQQGLSSPDTCRGGGVEGGGCLCAYMGLFPGSLDVQADKWLGCGWQLRLEMHFESRLTQGCSQGVAMPH